MNKKFLRQDTRRHLKIGKRHKKLQKWRKPKGRHNKMRKKRKSYPATVSIGYRKSKILSGKIKGKIPIMILNEKDFQKAKKENIIILSSRLGAKKKIEIIKKASINGIHILNLNNVFKENSKWSLKERKT